MNQRNDFSRCFSALSLQPGRKLVPQGLEKAAGVKGGVSQDPALPGPPRSRVGIIQ